MEPQFEHIVRHIQQVQANALASVNRELINLYWQMGQYLHFQLQNSHWGDKTMVKFDHFVKQNHPELKGFERRNLYRMIQFYQTYAPLTQTMSAVRSQMQNAENEENKIVSAVRSQLDLGRKLQLKANTASPYILDGISLSDIRNTDLSKLSWTHHRLILSSCESTEEKLFYIKLCLQEKYSSRQLERQIKAAVFERIMQNNATLPATVKNLHPNILNTFKDNYVFEFLNLKEPFNEHDLQKELVVQFKNVLLELGADFLFIANEYKLMVGQSDFYIDLLLYHRNLQCLVAIELKTEKFKPEHLGQLNFYLEALDRDVKKENENPSIGILLCKNKEQEVVEYALSRSLSPTMVAKYQLSLPDKKLLQQKLVELFMLQNNQE